MHGLWTSIVRVQPLKVHEFRQISKKGEFCAEQTKLMRFRLVFEAGVLAALLFSVNAFAQSVDKAGTSATDVAGSQSQDSLSTSDPGADVDQDLQAKSAFRIAARPSTFLHQTGDAPPSIRISVRNPSQTEVLQILPPLFEDLRLVRSGGEFVPGTLNATVDAKGCGKTAGRIVIPVGKTCTMLVKIEGDLRPGVYRARLLLDSNIGSETVDIEFRSGGSWWVAALYISAGAAIGMLIGLVRGPGRARSAAYAEALRLKVSGEVAIRAGVRSGLASAEVLQPLSDRIARHVELVYAGKEGDLVLAERIAALDRFGWNASRSASLDAVARAQISPAFNSALAALLERGDADVAPSVQALNDAVTEALTSAANRDGTESAAAASTGIAIPDVALFPPDVTLPELVQLQDRLEWLLAVASFAIVLPLALQLLWNGNDSWGGLADIVQALLVGAGSFVGVSAAIDAIKPNLPSTEIQ